MHRWNIWKGYGLRDVIEAPTKQEALEIAYRKYGLGNVFEATLEREHEDRDH